LNTALRFLTFSQVLFFVVGTFQVDCQIRISPSEMHEAYWSIDGEELVLLGGSNEDNLFQVEDLEEQLRLLTETGGNYVRNTMSSRDEGNRWPFMQVDGGKYDLNKFDTEYWERFEKFLERTAHYGVVVQLEIWATFDFYREPWNVNPFNPQNNINYSESRSKLKPEIATHPIFTENDFFRSTPQQLNLAVVLWYQKQFVDKLLSYSLQYDHVLYCMDNETSVPSTWGSYWSNYIQREAFLQDKKVHTTEMWDPHDLDHPMHNETFDHPEIYSFVDISQNNHNGGDTHWNNGLKKIDYLKKMGYLRPVNNVKIYGNDGGAHQTTQNAIASFCKNVLFGAASARFHRPPSGQGINQTAQHVIKSMSIVLAETDFFGAVPDNRLLLNRSENEAFCRAIPGKEYVIYFPDGGQISLASGANCTVNWIPVLDGEMQDKIGLSAKDGQVEITSPGPGNWIAIVKVN